MSCIRRLTLQVVFLVLWVLPSGQSKYHNPPPQPSPSSLLLSSSSTVQPSHAVFNNTTNTSYMDEKGTVTSFALVPWNVLHGWLSEMNGNPHISLPKDEQLQSVKGVTHSKVVEELEARRKKPEPDEKSKRNKTNQKKFGYGKDWRHYQNAQGFTHFEELLIHQPKFWRKTAREYLLRFQCDVNRKSWSHKKRAIQKDLGGNGNNKNVSLVLESPIDVVLFHPEIKRTARYEPLNFLLAYGAQDSLPKHLETMEGKEQELLMKEISPLDYFISFQNFVSGYKLDLLQTIGKENAFPRLCLIKELDFSEIVGQRLAKQLIRQAVVNHIWNRSGNDERKLNTRKQPLSMIFAGPSGNGKTELAQYLGKLLNKQDEDFSIKVDCGKLSDANEMFGMSGPYQGASEGSALNNFVLRMSKKPDSLGIVLLDEIEKSHKDVIHGLYQVIDKGEWTNKRLIEGSGMQTETIPCHNLVFIMTTNACDTFLTKYVENNEEIYTAVGEDFHDIADELSTLLRGQLRSIYPFTDAFIGRVGRVIPFLPMANGDTDLHHLLSAEMETIAKLLIEQQQEKYSKSETARVYQHISPKTKHRMAKIIVRDSIRDAGVRSIQKGVESKMGDRVQHALLLEKGGIHCGSEVDYFAREEDKKIDFWLKRQGENMSLPYDEEEMNNKDKNGAADTDNVEKGIIYSDGEFS